MNRIFKSTAFLLLITSLGITGCAQKTAESSSAAIETSKSMQASAQEKADYLINQARAFYKTERFQDSIETAQYVLSSLDKNSQQAKDLIEDAKNALIAEGQKAVEDAKKKLGF